MKKPILIVASHGALATSALESASQIFGEFKDAAAIGLDPNGRLDDLEKGILAAIKSLGEDAPVLLLVDLFGGSCSNVSARILKSRKETDPPIRVVAGFNLAMLIEYAFSRENYDFDALCDRILEAGKKACLDVSAKFKVIAR